jgi:hypothetical protein
MAGGVRASLADTCIRKGTAYSRRRHGLTASGSEGGPQGGVTGRSVPDRLHASQSPPRTPVLAFSSPLSSQRISASKVLEDWSALCLMLSPAPITACCPTFFARAQGGRELPHGPGKALRFCSNHVSSPRSASSAGPGFYCSDTLALHSSHHDKLTTARGRRRATNGIAPGLDRRR